MSDLNPEALAAWREELEAELRDFPGEPEATRILALLDELGIGIRAHVRTMERAEQAERKYADLVAAVRGLADGIHAGTHDFMAGYERAGEGISTRMSGETAAMIVQVRSEMESYVRALVKESE